MIAQQYSSSTLFTPHYAAVPLVPSSPSFAQHLATAQETSSSSWCTNKTNPPSCKALSCGVSSQSQDNNFHYGMHRFTEAIELAKYDNLTPFDVKCDGACLFRAIQFSRSGSEEGHVKLRADTVK